MATLSEISDSLDLAKAYFVELLNEYRLKLVDGDIKPKGLKKLICLNRLIRALTWDVNDEVNDDTTTELHILLLKDISAYPGAILPIDPDVVIPGSTISVTVISAPPERLYFDTDNPTIPDWQGVYASRFGNDPTLAVFISNGSGFFTQDVSASPSLQYDGTDTLLQSVSYQFGVSQTGYILIST